MPFLFAALLLAAEPVTPPAAPAPPQTVTTKPVKEKKICKTDDTDSTSRIRKRVCLTESEWERRNAGVTGGDLRTLGAQ